MRSHIGIYLQNAIALHNPTVNNAIAIHNPKNNTIAHWYLSPKRDRSS
ncbi:hypothetical protein [Brunnivagina elsteri]|nr:hypothetical protein [Calothrix elsteri]